MKRLIAQITVPTVLASVLVAQQATPVTKEPELAVRVTTRMVLVDAIVLDREGHPVKGLKADDFTLTEGGVSQRVASFSEHGSGAVTQAGVPPVIPPHVTTNRPVVTQANAENQTIAVLMLDGLNTPAQDQIFVKQQMLKFLAREYDPNTKLAVIALTNKLTVLQNFTQDPLVLRAALNRYLAETPAMARSGGQLETTSPLAYAPVVTMPAQATGGPGGSSGPDPGFPPPWQPVEATPALPKILLT